MTEAITEALLTQSSIAIRSIIREDPDILTRNPQLRVSSWSVLLLNSNNNEECYENVDIHAPACREQHVLENDVPRTRADVEHFQSDAYQVALKSILQKFCVQHRIE